MEKVNILSLLIGAGLAIVGGLVGQLVAFWLKTKEDRRKYRRDRLDQLMMAFGEDEHWMNEHRRSLCYGDGEHSTAEPFDRVKATVHLYFRDELGQILMPLLDARHRFYEKIGRAYVDRTTIAMAAGLGSVSTTAPSQAKLEEMEAAHAPYYEALLEFREACVQVAQEFV